MRISEIIASLIPRVRPIGPARNVSGTESVSGIHSRPDQVVLSDESQLMYRLTNALRNTPEIDEAKVAELRAKIEAGQFEVSGQAIASKILGTEPE